jgi:hypothetical protein
VTDSEIADRARGVSKCLSYNDSGHEAEAKHLLLEMAHRLDTNTTKAKKTEHGWRVVNALGRWRSMTWRERIAHWIAGSVPRV